MKNSFLVALIAIVAFTIQSCDKEEGIPDPSLIAIGDFHEGGVIFYLDSSGEHGLACAVIDQGFDIEWGCPSLLSFGAKGLAIGTGKQNTVDILNACNEENIAAALCEQFESNGYDDWFLPSRDELDSLYQHLDIVNETALEQEGGGILYNGGEYWSSSHYLDNTVWIQSFSAGNQSSATKDKKYYVRAIRTF